MTLHNCQSPAFCLLLLGSLSACALFGGGEATLERADRYRLSPPIAWTTKDRESSDRAYQTKTGSVVTVVSSCHRNSRAPLEALTRNLLLGMRDIKYGEREEVVVGDSKGLLSRVSATVDKKKFNLALFVVSLDGCIFDFSLINPKTLSDTEVSEFKTFARSLKYGTH